MSSIKALNIFISTILANTKQICYNVFVKYGSADRLPFENGGQQYGDL